MSEDSDLDQIISISAEIVAAYVSHNPIPASELPALIDNIHRSLSDLSARMRSVESGVAAPAVPVKKSVHDDYIVCLEDGQKFKSLKRHLATRYGMTPEAYRQKWNLPTNYPMVAPSYSAARSKLAKTMGLGKKGDVRPGGKRKRSPKPD